MNRTIYDMNPRDIASAGAPLLDLISQIRSHLNSQIIHSVETNHLDWTKKMVSCAERLQKIEDKIVPAVFDELESIITQHISDDPDASARGTDGLRVLEVQVSEGMLNQNLMTLTNARKKGMIASDERFHVTLPDGSRFKTELCSPGNRFRERSMIRKFYENENVQPEESVYLVEVEEGSWKLVSENSEEGKLAEKTVGKSSKNLLRDLIRDL